MEKWVKFTRRSTLGQSMGTLDLKVIALRRGHVEKVLGQNFTALRLEKLETEPHVQTVLASANAQVIDAIRRNQIPVIPTHSTFASQVHVEELGRTLEEHLEIYDLIAQGRKRGAMKSLETHVRRAPEPNIVPLRQIAPLPASVVPCFLTVAD